MSTACIPSAVSRNTSVSRAVSGHSALSQAAMASWLSTTRWPAATLRIASAS
jgi:hypothetical protein